MLTKIESSLTNEAQAFLGKVGQTIIGSNIKNEELPNDLSGFWVHLSDVSAPHDLLDRGASKIIITPQQYTSIIIDQKIPLYRVALQVNSSLIGDLVHKVAVETLIINFGGDVKAVNEASFIEICKGIAKLFPKTKICIDVSVKITTSMISESNKLGIDLVIPSSIIKSSSSSKSKELLNLGEIVYACVNTDRSDKLIPTVVVDEYGIALGLVYSSAESISESIYTDSGVYQSRSRGLWYKGKTSGATQELLNIDLDCESNSLRFTVRQKSGFCHKTTRTCWGHDRGITSLFQLLRERKANAPPDSYTKRLFDDEKLLNAKIREEADELCDAKDKNEAAWEAADLIYFALAKCTAMGVSLEDIENNLDAKSRKVSRRPGNAKPKYTANETNKPPVDEPKKEEKEFDSPSPLIHMKVYDQFSTLSQEKQTELLNRPIMKTDQIVSIVKPILEDVRKRGDDALLELTLKFDKVSLESNVLMAPFPAELMAITDEVKKAIDVAFDNIHKFHSAQLDPSYVLEVETMPGVVCSRFVRPIEKVGVYVPGGSAVLPSTALMLGIPALVAGCKQIVVATPPMSDGRVCPEVVYVAHKIGAKMILKAGGAQAIGAMAFGTATVPKVDKICGPGNQFVTAAKMIVQNDSSAMVSIDMPAGPSEVLVIADNDCIPAYVVSDLLSQAEHGPDSQVILLGVNLSSKTLSAIQNELNSQALALPRCEIVRKSIAHSHIIMCSSRVEAMKISNAYAPEHLILHVEKEDELIALVENAGSVFMGKWAPESCGDYASGTNHTLPTYGYAKMYSGVNTNTFVKHITSQKLTREGLNNIGDAVMTLAEIEGLQAHRNAVAIRLNDLRK